MRGERHLGNVAVESKIESRKAGRPFLFCLAGNEAHL